MEKKTLKPVVFRRRNEISKRKKRTVKWTRTIKEYCKETDLFRKKGGEEEKRERKSVRNYSVQLAELFHLVGLPSGTTDGENDSGRKEERAD